MCLVVGQPSIALFPLLATLALAAGAQAMSSASYQIEWLMAFVGSGGEASSTSCRAQSRGLQDVLNMRHSTLPQAWKLQEGAIAAPQVQLLRSSCCYFRGIPP